MADARTWVKIGDFEASVDAYGKWSSEDKSPRGKGILGLLQRVNEGWEPGPSDGDYAAAYAYRAIKQMGVGKVTKIRYEKLPEGAIA